MNLNVTSVERWKRSLVPLASLAVRDWDTLISATPRVCPLRSLQATEVNRASPKVTLIGHEPDERLWLGFPR